MVGGGGGGGGVESYRGLTKSNFKVTHMHILTSSFAVATLKLVHICA